MADTKDGVGYQRPPVRTRFKPGTSGNPSGRPKQTPNFQAALSAELTKMVAQGPEQGSKMSALVRTLVDAAIGGNMRALAVLVPILMRASDTNEGESEAITQEESELLDAYLTREIKRRARAAKSLGPASEPPND
jgi:hypothetical protein